MKPTWESGGVKLYLGDCLDVLPTLEAGSVDLCFVDPPYNIGIFCKMSPTAYLEWCEQWIAACSRVLAPNGAFWVSHSKPDVLTDISRIIGRYGRKQVNWVTWDKYNAAGSLQGFLDGYTVLPDLRSFQQMAEYLIYHADEGEWTSQCDRERGFIFEPLRAYLDGEKERAGISTRQVAEEFQKKTGSRTVTGMAGHWFSRVQWTLPTEENYEWLRYVLATGNHNGEYLRREYEDLRREYEDLRREYEYLRREYEYLRREYEDLRYTFNNPGKVSSVWQFAPAAKTGHETPKPEPLMSRIIETTTNPGDVVLDPMMGRGTTGKVAIGLGRSFIGCEIAPRHFNPARQRIEAAQNEMVQVALL